MECEVRFHSAPRRDLEAVYAYVTRGQPEDETAHAWYFGLRDAILSLGSLPLRGVRVAGSPKHRQLLYGNLPHVYRTIYQVQGQVVHVVHIRHGARKSFGLR